ncbi:hypothetical protein [Paenibacillus camerounensis]|uniref:hypothetical protein n=1 Tax=Paenibacillus camerounensis TaxID=1243663 RepID=UPI0005AB44CA|nr:hypothetical protein [Paenibacillus camerounensis]
MNVVIVNCFDTYEERIDLLHEYFVSKGHSVTIIQSNFRHFKKEFRTEQKKDFLFIPTKPYYKNMSYARMKSHYEFAKKAFKQIEMINPDLLYAVIPPNSIAKFAAKYKKNNPRIKLIFDLIDLWPETMPIGSIKNLPPFTSWKSMRDNSLKYADFVISECDLYRTILKDKLIDSKVKTLYLAKKELSSETDPILSEDKFHLCYLGSINNIIDILKIKRISNCFNKVRPTTLHIIGDGENRDDLIKELTKAGVSVEYYGKVYDNYKKQNIFDICHFGLNIMKDSVCVGLTMKSIDYFQAGIPIINNIKSDTSKIVETYKVGINYNDEDFRSIVKKIDTVNKSEYYSMRRNAKKVYNELFSHKSFISKMDNIMEELLQS